MHCDRQGARGEKEPTKVWGSKTFTEKKVRTVATARLVLGKECQLRKAARSQQDRKTREVQREENTTLRKKKGLWREETLRRGEREATETKKKPAGRGRKSFLIQKVVARGG